MAEHNDLGKLGEQIAKDFLLQKGYVFLTANYRYKKSEVDLIVKDGETMVFVEVKTRSGDFLFDPEKAMTRQKEAQIRQGAVAYMRKVGHEWAIRFDVIAIVIREADRYEVRHTEDAFF